MKDITLVSVPFDLGASQLGCRMGPDALHVACLGETLENLGFSVALQDITVPEMTPMEHANPAVHHLAEVVAWTEAIADASERAMGIPIFLGGDHSISAGTVSGRARAAVRAGKPLFVLWLDAHSDFHTLDTTDSGNLHGTPVAYFTGQKGFDPFPGLDIRVPEENICMLGLRSVDNMENDRLKSTKIIRHDMRDVDEYGMANLVRAFLEKVVSAGGWLHVSLDVDFLEPEIAPAVGTTVPGGASFREAHLVMEVLHESGLVRSLDIVELNPFLDLRGKTAKLLTDLTASLFGRRIMDRVTRSY